MKKKLIITGILCFSLGLIVFVFLMRYVMDEVNVMSNDQRVSKTANYATISEDTFDNATVFFGDSITELCPLNEVYAQYIKQSGAQVINRGISGETTDAMLKRIESNVLSIKPKNLVMLMGINDLGQGTSQDVIVENISKMIDLTKATCPKTNIILEAVYPVNISAREHMYEKIQMGDRTNEMVYTLNEKLANLAKEKQITFLDLTEYLIDENSELKEEYTFDGLHPNMEGYMAVRDEIIGVLK